MACTTSSSSSSSSMPAVCEGQVIVFEHAQYASQYLVGEVIQLTSSAGAAAAEPCVTVHACLACSPVPATAQTTGLAQADAITATTTRTTSQEQQQGGQDTMSDEGDAHEGQKTSHTITDGNHHNEVNAPLTSMKENVAEPRVALRCRRLFGRAVPHTALSAQDDLHELHTRRASLLQDMATSQSRMAQLHAALTQLRNTTHTNTTASSSPSPAIVQETAHGALHVNTRAEEAAQGDEIHTAHEASHSSDTHHTPQVHVQQNTDTYAAEHHNDDVTIADDDDAARESARVASVSCETVMTADTAMKTTTTTARGGGRRADEANSTLSAAGTMSAQTAARAQLRTARAALQKVPASDWADLRRQFHPSAALQSLVETVLLVLAAAARGENMSTEAAMQYGRIWQLKDLPRQLQHVSARTLRHRAGSHHNLHIHTSTTTSASAMSVAGSEQAGTHAARIADVVQACVHAERTRRALHDHVTARPLYLWLRALLAAYHATTSSTAAAAEGQEDEDNDDEAGRTTRATSVASQNVMSDLCASSLRSTTYRSSLQHSTHHNTNNNSHEEVMKGKVWGENDACMTGGRDEGDDEQKYHTAASTHATQGHTQGQEQQLQQQQQRYKARSEARKDHTATTTAAAATHGSHRDEKVASSATATATRVRGGHHESLAGHDLARTEHLIHPFGCHGDRRSEANTAKHGEDYVSYHSNISSSHHHHKADAVHTDRQGSQTGRASSSQAMSFVSVPQTQQQQQQEEEEEDEMSADELHAVLHASHTTTTTRTASEAATATAMMMMRRRAEDVASRSPSAIAPEAAAAPTPSLPQNNDNNSTEDNNKDEGNAAGDARHEEEQAVSNDVAASAAATVAECARLEKELREHGDYVALAEEELSALDELIAQLTQALTTSQGQHITITTATAALTTSTTATTGSNDGVAADMDARNDMHCVPSADTRGNDGNAAAEDTTDVALQIRPAQVCGVLSEAAGKALVCYVSTTNAASARGGAVMQYANGELSVPAHIKCRSNDMAHEGEKKANEEDDDGEDSMRCVAAAFDELTAIVARHLTTTRRAAATATTAAPLNPAAVVVAQPASRTAYEDKADMQKKNSSTTATTPAAAHSSAAAAAGLGATADMPHTMYASAAHVTTTTTATGDDALRPSQAAEQSTTTTTTAVTVRLPSAPPVRLSASSSAPTTANNNNNNNRTNPNSIAASSPSALRCLACTEAHSAGPHMTPRRSHSRNSTHSTECNTNGGGIVAGQSGSRPASRRGSHGRLVSRASSSSHSHSHGGQQPQPPEAGDEKKVVSQQAQGATGMLPLRSRRGSLHRKGSHDRRPQAHAASAALMHANEERTMRLLLQEELRASHAELRRVRAERDKLRAERRTRRLYDSASGACDDDDSNDDEEEGQEESEMTKKDDDEATSTGRARAGGAVRHASHRRRKKIQKKEEDKTAAAAAGMSSAAHNTKDNTQAGEAEAAAASWATGQAAATSDTATPSKQQTGLHQPSSNEEEHRSARGSTSNRSSSDDESGEDSSSSDSNDKDAWQRLQAELRAARARIAQLEHEQQQQMGKKAEAAAKDTAQGTRSAATRAAHNDMKAAHDTTATTTTSSLAAATAAGDDEGQMMLYSPAEALATQRRLQEQVGALQADVQQHERRAHRLETDLNAALHRCTEAEQTVERQRRELAAVWAQLGSTSSSSGRPHTVFTGATSTLLPPPVSDATASDTQQQPQTSSSPLLPPPLQPASSSSSAAAHVVVVAEARAESAWEQLPAAQEDKAHPTLPASSIHTTTTAHHTSNNNHNTAVPAAGAATGLDTSSLSSITHSEDMSTMTGATLVTLATTTGPATMSTLQKPAVRPATQIATTTTVTNNNTNSNTVTSAATASSLMSSFAQTNSVSRSYRNGNNNNNNNNITNATTTTISHDRSYGCFALPPTGPPVEPMTPLELRHEVYRLRQELERYYVEGLKYKTALQTLRERQHEERRRRSEMRVVRYSVLQSLQESINNIVQKQDSDLRQVAQLLERSREELSQPTPSRMGSTT